MKRPSLTAVLLYAALAAFANPAPAQDLTAERRAELAALRDGDLRKLTFHDAPVPAPDTPFSDREGNETTLAASNGRVRLVNFWATWCAPCRREKPALDALQRELGGPDFEVIAIATGRNSPESIDAFNTEVGIRTLDTWLDPKGKLAAAMNVPGLPVTVLLNREGQEIARLLGGADWTSDSARAIIAGLIAAP
jgi:thiol-disulfide isomerase/thioredoxin